MKKKRIVAFCAVCVIALAGCKVVLESNPVAEQKPIPVGSIAVDSVTFNKSTLALTPAATGKLTATVKPDNASDKTITWSSSNTEIATVDSNGIVTAYKVGNTTITAQAGGKKATCTVTVKLNPIAVQNVTLDSTSLTLAPGATKKLTATVKPDDADDKSVTWLSSDKTIATVDGGTVRAVKAGTATITAQAGDQKATCVVTISSPSGGENDNDFVIENGVLIKYTGAKSTVTIPAGVTQIGSEAFKGCTNLTTVNIPTGVTSIGDSAFNGCTSLTTVNIPESVHYIGVLAFSGCTVLTSVTIPVGVKNIEYGAFMDCSNLTEVTITNGVESIGESVFARCRMLTNITIPNGMKSIGDSAFQDCLKLAKVSIPATVNSVGRFTFSNNSTSLVLNYGGTKNQWDAIKGIDIILLAKGTTIKCTDTTWTVK